MSSLDSNGAEVYAYWLGAVSYESWEDIMKLWDSISNSVAFWKVFLYLAFGGFGGGDISDQLGATFYHVLRELNDVADGLAKEGVFHLIISYDV